MTACDLGADGLGAAAVRLGPVTVTSASTEQLVADAVARVRERRNGLYIPLYSAMLWMMHRDPDYARLVESADVVFPDGAGVAWYANQQLGAPRFERRAGTDIWPTLVRGFADAGVGLQLVGGSHSVNDAFTAQVRALGADVRYHQDGYWDPREEDAAVARIAANGPSAVLLAMGPGRQERLAHKLFAADP